jgi:hypothetical protein
MARAASDAEFEICEEIVDKLEKWTHERGGQMTYSGNGILFIMPVKGQPKRLRFFSVEVEEMSKKDLKTVWGNSEYKIYDKRPIKKVFPKPED